MVVFDCGAHIGEYSLLCSRRVGHRGRVHAFEPDPRTCAKLEANVAGNRLTNVVVNRAALGARQGPVTFLMTEDATTSSVQHTGEAAESRQILVQMTTLDDYAARARLERADALKIDVEGAEAALLWGARRVLSELQPGLIFVECHSDENAAWVKAALSAAGYILESRCDGFHRCLHLVARKSRGETPCQ